MNFSKQTLDFLSRASRQKNPSWLERPAARAEYEKVLLLPLQNLAREVKKELQPLARDYNFPQKGIGRIKRSADRAKEYGSWYKDWVSWSAARPRTSRFDHNPNIFFLIQAEDKDDPILVAGGLYMPSSRQLRSIRDAIAEDASAFDKLFASKDFAKLFPGGFCDEKKAKRPPRGFDANHPRIEWLKLQGYFVWRGYSRKEFSSREFPKLVARDARQILRLNELLELALQKRLPRVEPKKKKAGAESSSLLDRLADVEVVRRPMDF